MRIKNIYGPIALLFFCSCNKIVEISQPVNTITSSETFATDGNAKSALAGIYGNMSSGNSTEIYSNGALAQLCGLSADELKYFDETNAVFMELQTNTVQTAYASGALGAAFWTPAYFNIYQANAAIEGLTASTTVSPALKQQLLGEAKFIRAFGHFYLVNLFGDVPLMTSTQWAKTNLLTRSSVSDVYNQIIADLKDAQTLMAPDYSMAGGERTRANKFAASALLARVYLYTGNYAGAADQSDAVIKENGLYSLVGNLDSAFMKNNMESIFELEVINNYPWCTRDGFQFIPLDHNSNPNYYLANQLLADFEPGDQRRLSWIDSTDFSGTFYYYPFKYKVRQGDAGNVTEDYIVLRLAEQYLIRAEALIRDRDDLSAAASDLNIIRRRAGLDDYSGPMDKDSLLNAILHERRVEFFAEFGHRWLDLKRLNLADNILPAIKPDWRSSQKLYPIPITELQSNPNLQQNPGY